MTNVKDYVRMLKLAEGKETFSDKPSTDKTDSDKKDQASDQEKNKQPGKDNPPPEVPQQADPNEEVGVAEPPMDMGPQSPMQGAIMEVLGPEIVMAASQGDPNAQRVLALTAAEVVKAMMGLGGGGMGGQMGGMGGQMPPMGQMPPQSPEAQAANGIVPQQMPYPQTPNGMYNQGMM